MKIEGFIDSRPLEGRPSPRPNPGNSPFLWIATVGMLLSACDSDVSAEPDATVVNPSPDSGLGTADAGSDGGAPRQADAGPVACTTDTPGSAAALTSAFLGLWTTGDDHERRCTLESVWAQDATYRSADGVFEGRDALYAHITANQSGARSLSSGVPVHHEGLRFTWTQAGASTLDGIALGQLDDTGRFQSMTSFSGEKSSALADLGPYERYLAAWNEVDPTTRATQLAQSWAENGTYFDPTAEGVGRGAVSTVIQTYLNQFANRLIVLDSVGHHFDNSYWVTWAIRNSADDEDLIVGMDFCQLTDDGEHIASLFSFFGDVPELGFGGNQGECLSCVQRQILGANPADLCTGGTPSSVEIDGQLNQCICTTACPTECGDNLCRGEAPSADCGVCLAQPGAILESCPAETEACWSDG